MSGRDKRQQQLHRRLLQDVAELQTRPYPNIELYIQDDNLTQACLVLTPDGWIPLHLTIQFPTSGQRYPLKPPTVLMDSKISHPNVFGTYICASILNTTEGYTPAYTLKAIAIQLLSFFGSDSIQQDYGAIVDLDRYRSSTNRQGEAYQCSKCMFGLNQHPQPALPSSLRLEGPAPEDTKTEINPSRFFVNELPNEILLEITDHLDFEDLANFSRSWARMSRLVTDFNVVRNRELQCFLLKENFVRQQLGIGVHLSGHGRQRQLESEFDLMSQTAFSNHSIRRSVHGMEFERWLPLPISHRHWRRVEGYASSALSALSKEARIDDKASVIFAFMNDIVVRLNTDLERQTSDFRGAKSTLRHASEKAIESYFHLFHLLLCLATGPEGKSIVGNANRMIKTFMSGKVTKDDIPNLGTLLIALLISDIEPNESLMRAIVKEAITRNVVWMLDTRGAGMAELGYLETDKVSQYRLKKTFQASRVSYRILMFSELFRRTARPNPPLGAKEPSPPPTPPTLTKSWSSVAAAKPKGSPSPPTNTNSPHRRKSLIELRDELFARYGAPPLGSAAHLASEVRRLQEIDEFPSFLKEMGVSYPGKETFTAVLRESMRDSVACGYHVWRPSPDLLGGLRIIRDRSINANKVVADIRKMGYRVPGPDKIEEARRNGKLSFFPGKGRK